MAKGDIKKEAVEAMKILTEAAAQAVKTVADAASQASKVVATNAQTASNVLNTNQSADHDLLIELKTTLAGVKQDIKGLADGTNKTVSDHETRIRAVESISEDFAIVKKVVYGAVGLILVAVVSSVIYLVVQK